MAAIIEVSDLPASLQSADLVYLMVDGANAKASRVAPCLASSETPPTPDQLDEARLILVGAVKRWAEAGSGSYQTQAAGPFSVGVDTRQRTGYNLWPSEIEALQQVCKSGTDSSSGAFSITPTVSTSAHMPWCAVNMGATYCSCGADLTNYEYPLYEGGVLTGDEY